MRYAIPAGAGEVPVSFGAVTGLACDDHMAPGKKGRCRARIFGGLPSFTGEQGAWFGFERGLFFF